MKILLCDMTQNLGLSFWIPIVTSLVLSIGLAIWNLYQQIRIENLKKEKEKQLNVHRLQFEKEFNIYNELWSKLVDLRAAITKLRPEADSTDQDKTYEETIQIRLSKAIEIGNEVIESIEKNKPFYAKTIYNELGKIIKLIRLEIFEVRKGELRVNDYWERGKKNSEEMLEIIEVICDAIRERIGNLEVK